MGATGGAALGPIGALAGILGPAALQIKRANDERQQAEDQIKKQKKAQDDLQKQYEDRQALQGAQAGQMAAANRQRQAAAGLVPTNSTILTGPLGIVNSGMQPTGGKSLIGA